MSEIKPRIIPITSHKDINPNHIQVDAKPVLFIEAAPVLQMMKEMADYLREA